MYTEKIPYHIQVLPPSLTIGLADDCVTKTLVDLTFMIKSKPIHSVVQKKITITAFGSAWLAIHESPLKINAPPQHMLGVDLSAVLLTNWMNNIM